MGKVMFKLKQKMLSVSMLFGQKHYMKKVVKLYKKAGVEFDGMPKYLDRNARLDCSPFAKIHIGEGTVITTETVILVHDYSIDVGLISIEKANKDKEATFYKDVFIGRNTFIGQRSIILPGVTIGNNCIIGAGCVVSKDIPDDSVVVGCPCKIIANTKEWANKHFEAQDFDLGNDRTLKL